MYMYYSMGKICSVRINVVLQYTQVLPHTCAPAYTHVRCNLSGIVHDPTRTHMGWLWLVGSLKI